MLKKAEGSISSWYLFVEKLSVESYDCTLNVYAKGKFQSL